MTDEARNVIAWFYARYPRGDDGSIHYERDAKRAQEMLIDLKALRRSEALVIAHRMGWRDLSHYPPALSGKFYRGPNALVRSADASCH